MKASNPSPKRRLWMWAVRRIGLIAFGMASAGQDAVRLGFPSEAGRAYEIWESADAVRWRPLDLDIPGSGARVVRTVGATGEPSQFFRLRARPEPYELLDSRVQPGVGIDDVRSGFAPAGWREAALEALGRRFPDAAGIVRRHRSPGGFDFWFGGRTSDWGQVMEGLSAAVHESVHIVGFEAFHPSEYRLPMSGESMVSVRRIPTFPRSEVLGDLPPGLADSGYSSTYLQGPSGGQGFETLLDELNAYTFSLLVDWAFLDQFPPGSRRSSRDGLLAMMVYTGVVLKVARDWHPEVHQRILETPGWAEGVVKLWDRAVQAIRLSGTDPKLELGEAPRHRAHAFSAELLAEIEILRARVVPALSIGTDR